MTKTSSKMVIELNDDCTKEHGNNTLQGGALHSLYFGCAQQRKIGGFSILYCAPLGDISVQKKDSSHGTIERVWQWRWGIFEEPWDVHLPHSCSKRAVWTSKSVSRDGRRLE